jgi:O-antigen/teichoic acid export membrane protein
MATSFSWKTLTVVLQVVIQLAYTGLLARMVAKDSFMLMGIVLGIMGFAEIFSQVGVGPALIQRKEVILITLLLVVALNQSNRTGNYTSTGGCVFSKRAAVFLKR